MFLKDTLHSCAVAESNLSIERVKLVAFSLLAVRPFAPFLHGNILTHSFLRVTVEIVVSVCDSNACNSEIKNNYANFLKECCLPFSH